MSERHILFNLASPKAYTTNGLLVFCMRLGYTHLIAGMLFCGFALWLPSQAHAREDVYQEPKQFLEEVFRGDVPKAKLLWLTKKMRPDIRRILGHDMNKLRLRYWRQGTRSAWILEEIGKEKPITVGLVVNGDRLERVKVLIFRESRGWEVRYPFFTDQFIGSRLKANQRLDRRIDGIAGATLSVRALTKLARLALHLHRQTGSGSGSIQ